MSAVTEKDVIESLRTLVGNQAKTIDELRVSLHAAREERDTLTQQLAVAMEEIERLTKLSQILCDHKQGWTEDNPGGNKCCNICWRKLDI